MLATLPWVDLPGVWFLAASATRLRLSWTVAVGGRSAGVAVGVDGHSGLCGVWGRRLYIVVCRRVAGGERYGNQDKEETGTAGQAADVPQVQIQAQPFKGVPVLCRRQQVE